jgi:hypothetical protein
VKLSIPTLKADTVCDLFTIKVKKQFYNNIKECLNVTKENKKGKKGTN